MNNVYLPSNKINNRNKVSKRMFRNLKKEEGTNFILQTCIELCLKYEDIEEL